MTSASVERKTKETDIRAKIAFPGTGQVSIKTTVPFFDHMLTALFFHGGFDAEISAEGKSIFAHDPAGKVAQAYHALTKEVLQLERQRQKHQSDLIR